MWQLEPQQFSLRNAAWKPFIASIVAAVRQEFGIPQKVEHQLSKLLVYEKGGFFAPHRDSEKTPGMFAMLIRCPIRPNVDRVPQTPCFSGPNRSHAAEPFKFLKHVSKIALAFAEHGVLDRLHLGV
ncbi:MAG: hypothetical protein MUE50_10250 [Pirellulaceae bacterium]|nr:hypothetical protein [Pirellulaceae bacterium]